MGIKKGDLFSYHGFQAMATTTHAAYKQTTR